jgi:phage shock protein PspC (stress-responsive transcriptional regulator)
MVVPLLALQAGPMDDTSGSSPSGPEAPAPPTQGSGQEQSRQDEGPLRLGRLHRCREGRMLAGVAAGLAEFFDVDPTLVRVGFVALALLGGLAVPLYLAAWLLIPEADTEVSLAEELLTRERAMR